MTVKKIIEELYQELKIIELCRDEFKNRYSIYFEIKGNTLVVDEVIEIVVDNETITVYDDNRKLINDIEVDELEYRLSSLIEYLTENDDDITFQEWRLW